MDPDQTFKNLILAYPRKALECLAAEEAANLGDEARITPIRQEQLKDRLSDRFRELDIPLQVEWLDGQRELLLFILEEETDPGRFSRHRLARYCLDLAELFATDRVVPVVVFLNRGPKPDALRLGGDRYTYLDFRYLGLSPPSEPYERYRDSANLVARLNLPNVAYLPEQKLEVYHHAFRGLLDLDPDRQAKYLDFLDLYAKPTPEEQAEYRRRYPEEVEVKSTFAERYEEKGRQEGHQAGEAEVLLGQLEAKFGDLRPADQERVRNANTATLQRWSLSILTAESLAEVFGEA